MHTYCIAYANAHAPLLRFVVELLNKHVVQQTAYKMLYTYMLDHLQEWVSEFVVRTYPTSDSGLTYLIHAEIA